ncbi:MAG: hypothetical protein RLZ81_1997, partial [Pseudomonadota bacterium]
MWPSGALLETDPDRRLSRALR